MKGQQTRNDFQIWTGYFDSKQLTTKNVKHLCGPGAALARPLGWSEGR